MAEAETNVLNIVGEQVTLTETTFPLRESFIVQFDPDYKFQEITADEEIKLKKALQTVFRKSGLLSHFKPPTTSDISGQVGFIGSTLNTLIPGTPLPPCNKDEKELIVKSLRHRFGILRAQVFKEKERDSLRFRNFTDHAYRLRDFLDFFEKTPDCGGEVSGEGVGELDDERIKTLLRQFIFMILQGQNPLDEYTSENRISPAELINKLETGALTKEEFDTFINQYREKEYPIAPRIEKVLQVTELDLNAIQAEIDAGIKKKIDEIIIAIREVIPDTNDDFWKSVDVTDLKSLFDRLLERLKARESEIISLKDEVSRQKNEIDSAAVREQEKEVEIADLKARIGALEAELEGAKQNAAQKNTNSSSLKAALAAAQDEIAGLKRNMPTLHDGSSSDKSRWRELKTRDVCTRIKVLVSSSNSYVNSLIF